MLFGQFARRHMIEYGTTSEQFGEVAVALPPPREPNPRAMMRTPITLDDHQASRMIADPLRLFDCCIESDGALRRDRDQRPTARATCASRPRWILGAAQGSGTRAVGIVFRETSPGAESVHTAPDVYRSAGVGPDDVDAVHDLRPLHADGDHALEDYGFCAPGEGGAVRRRRAHRGPTGGCRSTRTAATSPRRTSTA